LLGHIEAIADSTQSAETPWVGQELLANIDDEAAKFRGKRYNAL
jgi:hypothetical protein